MLDRYYSWYIPGLVLIGATCIRVLVGVRVQALALLLSCALIIASDGLKQRFNEDWRAAMAHTDQLHSETSAPVLLFSGINQSQLLSWFADSRKASFFSAPAFYYPLSTTPLVIPVAVKDHSGDQYWRNVVTPVLRTNSKVILVIFNNIFEETDAGRIDIKDKLLARAALHGHRPIESQQFQQVWVYSLGRKL